MNPQQERSYLCNVMHNVFKENVFKQREVHKLKAMAKLANKNYQLRRTVAPCFMYRGQWYTDPYNATMPRDTQDIDRTLDPSLHGEAAAIIYQDDFELVEEEAMISSMIGDAIAACSSLQSLRELLPSEMWLFPAWVSTEMFVCFDRGENLSPEAIEEFKLKHQRGYNALRKLYMTELLLAKVE